MAFRLIHIKLPMMVINIKIASMTQFQIAATHTDEGVGKRRSKAEKPKPVPIQEGIKMSNDIMQPAAIRSSSVRIDSAKTPLSNKIKPSVHQMAKT